MIPCRHCGQTRGDMFHSMGEMVNRYRDDSEEAWRRGDYDKSYFLREYMERLKADCLTAGYDFHNFEPLSNLEYLELKAAQKEGKAHEILYKRCAFGHANIIKYCARPFANAGEMNDFIITEWNKLVKPEDTVYHMGDVAFTSPDWCKHIVENLNGYKILILGNHDRAEEKMLERGFQEVHQSLRITLSDGTEANLSHYPYIDSYDDPHHKPKFETKSLKDDGRLLIHGHVHTAFKSKPGKFKNWMINVGMDQFNYRPISEADLIAYHQTLQK